MAMAAWTQAAVAAGRYAIAQPARAALEHGNQALVTLAAAYMAAQFSMQHEVLPAGIAWPLAAGFEWTYLRGLATADQTRGGRWAAALNWVAMLTSAVFGVLYILGHYKIIPDRPEPAVAVLLAVAHVLPMVLLSFCYAGVRRSYHQERMAETERRRRADEDHERRLQEQRDAMVLERERKLLEIETWRAGKQAMQDMQVHPGASAQNAPAPLSDAANAEPRLHTCTRCGASLSAKQYAAARRWGHCMNCREVRKDE